MSFKSAWTDHRIHSFVACVQCSPESSLVAQTGHQIRIAHPRGDHDTIVSARPGPLFYSLV